MAVVGDLRWQWFDTAPQGHPLSAPIARIFSVSDFQAFRDKIRTLPHHPGPGGFAPRVVFLSFAGPLRLFPTIAGPYSAYHSAGPLQTDPFSDPFLDSKPPTMSPILQAIHSPIHRLGLPLLDAFWRVNDGGG